jgi:hypothetical protein
MSVRVRPSAPSIDAKLSRLRAAFFVPEIHEYTLPLNEKIFNNPVTKTYNSMFFLLLIHMEGMSLKQ